MSKNILCAAVFCVPQYFVCRSILCAAVFCVPQYFVCRSILISKYTWILCNA